MSSKRALAIGAHPDDMEEFCGGTLLLLKKKGYETLIAVLTAGECGTIELPAEEIVTIRANEAKRAAKKIGAKYTCLNIRDGCVCYDLKTAKKLVKLIREYRPQIIFTHPTVDYMTDHTHTGKLVLWAVPESTHPNFPADTKAAALVKAPFVYHTDPQGLLSPEGQIVKVNTVIDITDVIKQKLRAIAAHKSQQTFMSLKSKKPIQYKEEIRRIAIIRGQQVHFEYAEGFTQQLLEHYPRHNILVDILQEKAITL